MNIISLCVYAILSVILILIIYRAYNYHFTENFTSKTPTSSNLSKIQKNVCPKPPPCPTCPIPEPCPTCPIPEPCPTCPIPEPCPTCPPPIYENKFTYEDYTLMVHLGYERLYRVLLDYFKKIDILKIVPFNPTTQIDISDINIKDDGIELKIYFLTYNQEEDHYEGSVVKKIFLPFHNDNEDCIVDFENDKYGCFKFDSF